MSGNDENIATTPSNLIQWMAEHQVQAELLKEIGDTPTVPAAADALGVEPHQIIKTLLFLITLPNHGNFPAEKQGLPQPIAVISNGTSRVNKKAIARHFNVGNKRVSLARPKQVLTETGFPAGGVPPFGHLNKNPVILDQAVIDLGLDTLVYGGGGDDKSMLALSVRELLRVVQPIQIMELSK